MNRSHWLEIDGSKGEGGGQVLRTALSLSMITGTPIRIEAIRGKRTRPGLMRQHLTALHAATAICNGVVSGDALHSEAVRFEPGPIQGGEYRFSIGTAGSATLVAQTLLPALLHADTPSRLTVEGGTHAPWSPPFPFLEQSYLTLLRTMGVAVSAQLQRPGFYPAGGGAIELEIEPVRQWRPLEITERGDCLKSEAVAIVANLDDSIARRELAMIQKRLNWAPSQLRIVREDRAAGPGNVVLVTFEYDHHTAIFSGFGRHGVRAETVSKQLLKEVHPYLHSPAAIDHHLADQLLLPMALAGQGCFTTGRPTQHTRTMVDLIPRFLPVTITLEQRQKSCWQVEIRS
ncbi:MAG: RNA 3'-terminal phosphate cyclase [Magnetococcales bacterium]|nr:RNA 3'-terminal phosphate cyclase [Magnetococcales bacterium]